MKKIFVTGVSGLLGSNIVETMPKGFEIYGSYNKNKVSFDNCELVQMDITNLNNLKILEDINPDVVIHCAANTNVDGCEKDPKTAFLQNTVGTENVVKIVEKIGCFLLQISTDAVFDGEKGNYVEDDEVNPVNVYGETKLKAEEIVQKSNVDFCIVRTNIYGWNKLDKFSLAEWMINKLEHGETFNGFTDVFFTPILVNNLSRVLFEIYTKNIQGILHVTGSECCSKYDFTRYIVEAFGFDENLVKKGSVKGFDLPAKRGNNLCLNTNKAQSLLDNKLQNIREGLVEMKKLKENGYLKKLKGL